MSVDVMAVADCSPPPATRWPLHRVEAKFRMIYPVISADDLTQRLRGSGSSAPA